MDYMDFIRPLPAVFFCIVAKNISDLKISNTMLAEWMAISYILAGLSMLISNLLSSIIIFIIIILMIYTDGHKLIISINTAMFAMIIMILSESAAGIILSRVYSNIDFRTLVTQDFRLLAPAFFLNFIFAYAISVAANGIFHKIIKIKQTGKVSIQATAVFLSSTLFVFLFIYITAITGSIHEYDGLWFVYIGFFSFLIILTYFVFKITAKEITLESNKKELKQLEEYTQNIESMHNEIRSIVHDYSNVLSSMSGYFSDDDIEGLKKYFTDEIIPFADYMKTADINLSALSRIKDSGLKGIMAIKLIYARENHVPVLVDIKDDIEIKSIGVVDLNRVMGILLDNAYESASQCAKPYVDVGITKDKNIISIIVINSTGEDVRLKNVFEPGFSTKGKGRGLGLNILIEILNKYPNAVLDTAAENGEFRQIIHIKEITTEE